MISGKDRPMSINLIQWFDLDNNGTDIRTEVLAGVTTFVASMYIITVNPTILHSAGMPFDAALTATVLVSAFSSIAMGLYAKNPLLVAPGMSLNALMATSVIQAYHVPWSTALGCVFWAGVIFSILTVLDRKKRMLLEIPPMIRFGLAGGIGLFIAMMGFESAGFIVPLESGSLGWGKISLTTITFLAGLMITSGLVVRKVRGSFIIGIAATALMILASNHLLSGAPVQALAPAKALYAMPDLSLVLQLDISGALSPRLWPVIFIFLFSCLFDSLSTCVGVCEAGNLIDEERVPQNLLKSMRVNALGVTLSGILGTSPSTLYIESATGVEEGGRTGLTALVSGLLFLPFLFLSPLLSLIPAIATAPVLVLAGVFMLKPLMYVRWERSDDAIPFFLAMFLMPLTHSITHGIIWGCLSWVLLKTASGKRSQIPPAMWAMAIFSILMLLEISCFSS
jgi:adenine/guanine/hypoxanthine permease